MIVISNIISRSLSDVVFLTETPQNSHHFPRSPGRGGPGGPGSGLLGNPGPGPGGTDLGGVLSPFLPWSHGDFHPGFPVHGSA